MNRKDEIRDTTLEKRGFKKIHPDEVDKEYFYWQKDYKCPLLKGLHIIVDEKISCYCTELTANMPNKYGDHVMLFSLERTIDNLDKAQAFTIWKL